VGPLSRETTPDWRRLLQETLIAKCRSNHVYISRNESTVAFVLAEEVGGLFWGYTHRRIWCNHARGGHGRKHP